MYATDRQTSDVTRASSLNAPYPRGGVITKQRRGNLITELLLNGNAFEDVRKNYESLTVVREVERPSRPDDQEIYPAQRAQIGSTLDVD